MRTSSDSKAVVVAVVHRMDAEGSTDQEGSLQFSKAVTIQLVSGSTQAVSVGEDQVRYRKLHIGS